MAHILPPLCRLALLVLGHRVDALLYTGVSTRHRCAPSSGDHEMADALCPRTSRGARGLLRAPHRVRFSVRAHPGSLSHRAGGQHSTDHARRLLIVRRRSCELAARRDHYARRHTLLKSGPSPESKVPSPHAPHRCPLALGCMIGSRRVPRPNRARRPPCARQAR